MPVSAKTSATAVSPPVKAAAWMPVLPRFSITPSEAPKPAPAETPRMSGDTIGLRNRFW